MIPRVHVPSREVRAWRRMIEHRQRLIEERTRAKNGLRALLRGLAIECPRGLWTQRGLAWLKAQPFAELLDAIARDDYVARIESLGQMLARVEKALNAVGRKPPSVALLMTIPGVGLRTAEAVVAYIDTPRRFGRNKAVGSYFGLVPCQDASAGTNRLGHITQQGPATVRRLLNQAAWQGVRRCPQIRAYYERVRRDDPHRKKIAIVATMHYLVRVMHAMLTSGELWRSSAA
jgi:transposase